MNTVNSTNTNIEFAYQEDSSILIVRIHGFQKAENAAKTREAFNELINQKKIKLILINQRDIKVLSREMQSFIADYIPEMVQKGIKKMAIILPEDVFALAGVTKIHSETKIPDLEMKTFNSEEQGINWLRE
jgi:vacuolar-type H+-ATPase subunit F/Vma7